MNDEEEEIRCIDHHFKEVVQHVLSFSLSYHSIVNAISLSQQKKSEIISLLVQGLSSFTASQHGMFLNSKNKRKNRKND